jgi:hypothetical protein
VPLEAGDGPGELRGVQEIMDNSGRLNADYQIHAVETGDPLVRGDQFAEFVRENLNRSSERMRLILPARLSRQPGHDGVGRKCRVASPRPTVLPAPS